MRKRFTLGAAGLAIAVSLAGTAHASETAADSKAVEIAAEDAADKNANSAERHTAAGDARESALAISPELLSAFNVAETSLPLSSTPLAAAAPVSEGVVTLRGVDPFYGDINPFYGDINPFYGDIDAFWGDINPFYGDIDAFWGDIDAFYGDIGAFDATALAAHGDFWKSHGAQITATEALFDSISRDASGAIVRDGTPDRVMASLRTLIAHAEAKFGAAYTAKTGKSFSSLVDEIFARHGADPDIKATIEILDARQRAALFLDWHDSLNVYSGVDAVDYWMPMINWTPSVTQIQGEGADTIIGIVDGSFSADADLGNNVLWTGGNNSELGGHGVGVASLIAGAHDGQGVMGIAPEVNIAAYNPFSADGTSSWDAVRDGITTLMYRYLGRTNETGYVSIINLSLGEKGWTLSQGLSDVLADNSIAPWHSETVFVVAAGNDGVAQTADIEWDFQREASAIFVGSVNPRGEISSFSNTAGSACLLDNGVCNEGNELFRRFVVAPGEMILVSDGQGGVVRRSGTSFAAPLVSGAISLLHDRWPWLVRHSKETTDIIFRSSRDLGAPGPDEVYGWGLLDVTASQSPLDFNAMTFNSYQRPTNSAGKSTGWIKKSVSATELLGGIPDWWETEDVFFTMFEDIGDTYRDFVVPVSAFQYGQTTNVLGRTERMQDFINQRFARWINSGGTDSNGDGLPGFTEVRSNGAHLNGDWSLRYDAIAPQYTQQGELRMVHSAATLTNPQGNMAFTVGNGQGSMALTGYRFGVLSDHDPRTGGVNPVLGFASGETFAAVSYEITPGTKVRVGFSDNRERWDEVGDLPPGELLLRRQLGDRPASAVTFDFEQKVTDKVSVNAQYTRLNEVNALLGTQTSSTALLGNGSKTDAMTVSASIDVGNGLTFDLSATGARTETDDGQVFANRGNIWSTAGQVSATKRGVFGGTDTLRVSIAQPLQVVRGELEVRSEQVVDRVTGETGIVSQTIGIETRQRITGEVVYATPLTTSSDFGVFSRYVSAGELNNEASFVVGGNINFRF